MKQLISYDILFKSAEPLKIPLINCFAGLSDIKGLISFNGNALQTRDTPMYVRYNVEHVLSICSYEVFFGYFKYLLDKGWGEFIDNTSPYDILDRGLLVPLSLPADILSSVLSVFRYAEMNWNINLFHHLCNEHNIHPDVSFMITTLAMNQDWMKTKAYSVGNFNHSHIDNSVTLQDISDYIYLFPYPSVVKPIESGWAGRMVFSYFMRRDKSKKIIDILPEREGYEWSSFYCMSEKKLVNFCKEIERRCL